MKKTTQFISTLKMLTNSGGLIRTEKIKRYEQQFYRRHFMLSS